VLKLCEDKPVPGSKSKEKSFNKNWKKEIAGYDDKCKQSEEDFYKHNIIIPESGFSELSEEENDVLILFLNGISCEEIAKQFEVETEIITGLLEIIRAKLSLNE